MRDLGAHKMAGFNPSIRPGELKAMEDPNMAYWPDWQRYLDTREWLLKEASDAEYWEYYRACKGFMIPKRPQDSWWDRFKAKHFTQ